jgi:hypothetical protein
MSRFSSSIWNVFWILGVPGIVMAGWVFWSAWRKRQWYYFFDAKHNRDFPADAGNFKRHWKNYEGLAKLCITLSAGAIAFLISLLANQSKASNGFAETVSQVAPLVIGFFGASIFLLISFLLWMGYCYEEYSHSNMHDTYRAWKYALTQSLGFMGFIGFLLGFIWFGSYVFAHAQNTSSSAAAVVSQLPSASVVQSPAVPTPQSLGAWLVSDKSVAAATWGLVVVTFLLVVVTALLVADGFRKSREQAKQWEEEQERRIAESKPSAIVELAAKEDTLLDMCFACFNLGNNTFYIDRMVVTTSDGARHESGLTPQIVTPGTWVTIDYNPTELLGMFGENQPFKEANCVLFLRGATGIVTTEPEWFYVGYGNGRADWHKGRLADRQPGVIPPQHKIIRVPKQSQ